MATNFVSYWTFALGAEVSQDLLDQFSQCLPRIELQMTNPSFFFRYFKGRCHGNQFCCKIVPKLPTPPALIALSFRNGMGCRYLSVLINTINDAAICHVKIS